jgi:PAS domain S-box-containing protein
MDRSNEQIAVLMDAFDLLPDAVFVVNAEGIIIANNTQALPLLGYCKNELQNKPLGILIPHKFRDAHQKHFYHLPEDYQSRKMGAGIKLWALHKEGHEIDVDIALSSFAFHDAKYSIAVLRDIGDKLKLEHTIGNLEHIKEELERFGYTVSHDLKGPLQRIKMLASLITLELAEEKQKDIQEM